MEASLAIALVFTDKSLSQFIGQCLSVDTRPVDVDDVPTTYQSAYEVLEFVDEPYTFEQAGELSWLLTFDTVSVMDDYSLLKEYAEPYLNAGASTVYAAVDYADYDGSDDEEEDYEGEEGEQEYKEDNQPEEQPEKLSEGSPRIFLYKTYLDGSKFKGVILDRRKLSVPDDLMAALRVLLDESSSLNSEK